MAREVIEQKEGSEPSEQKTPTDKITVQILTKLGKPPRYANTDIKRVGVNTYRANIYVSTQHEFKEIVVCMPMRRISDSFYVRSPDKTSEMAENRLGKEVLSGPLSTDNEGYIIQTNPSIVSKY